MLNIPSYGQNRSSFLVAPSRTRWPSYDNQNLDQDRHKYATPVNRLETAPFLAPPCMMHPVPPWLLVAALLVPSARSAPRRPEFYDPRILGGEMLNNASRHGGEPLNVSRTFIRLFLPACHGIIFSRRLSFPASVHPPSSQMLDSLGLRDRSDSQGNASDCTLGTDNLRTSGMGTAGPTRLWCCVKVMGPLL